MRFHCQCNEFYKIKYLQSIQPFKKKYFFVNHYEYLKYKFKDDSSFNVDTSLKIFNLNNDQSVRIIISTLYTFP